MYSLAGKTFWKRVGPEIGSTKMKKLEKQRIKITFCIRCVSCVHNMGLVFTHKFYCSKVYQMPDLLFVTLERKRQKTDLAYLKR